MTPPDKPGRGAILQAIKQLYENASFIPRDHFGQRLGDRQIPHSVLPSVFESAKIVRGPEWDTDNGNWRVTIEGDTADDEPVRLGLAVDIEGEMLFLLTAFFKD